MDKFLIKANILLLTFLAVFGITSCAAATEFSYRYVDEGLKEYVRNYHNLLRYHCPKARPTNFYSVTFVEDLKEDDPEKEHWIGLCTRKLNGYTIEIDSPWWRKASASEREQLMYHELGHCILKKEHVDDEYHYMYPSIIELPRETYLNQAIKDMETYCTNL